MAGETNVYAQDWSATTIRTLEQDTVWNRILPNFPVPMGYQSVKLPSATVVDVVDVNDSGRAGNNPHTADYSGTYAATTLTLDVDKAAIYEIPDNLRANTTFDSAALAGYESGQRMATALETSLSGKYNGGMTTDSLDLRRSGSLANPTGFRLQLAADNDGELVRRHFLEAEEFLLNNRVPPASWFCIVPPSLKRRGMVADDTFYTANNERGDARIHGMQIDGTRFLGNIWNFPVYVSTHNPRLHGTGTVGTKDTVFWGSTTGVVKHVRAYPFEGLRDRISLGDYYRQEFEWGLLVTRPNTVCRATYDFVSTS